MKQMDLSRRGFLGGLGAAGSALALSGCKCLFCGGPKAKVALQLYSIRTYIRGSNDPSTGTVRKGAGLAKALKDVAALGYAGVEFAGYYGHDAKTLKSFLDDAGLVACGTHVGRNEFCPGQVAATCEFNLAYGNDLLICPGGGNFPKKDEPLDDFLKMLVDYYNKAAEDAAKYGCKVGLHNHTREFTLRMKDGTTYWDYFFANTDPRVCMEQDVGWTTSVGFDPKDQYVKYPHRSPTLHAKENGSPDAILGQAVKAGVTPVDWDGLVPVTERDGVVWYVVECERHPDDLSAVGPSRDFLRSKGL